MPGQTHRKQQAHSALDAVNTNNASRDFGSNSDRVESRGLRGDGRAKIDADLSTPWGFDLTVTTEYDTRVLMVAIAEGNEDHIIGTLAAIYQGQVYNATSGKQEPIHITQDLKNKNFMVVKGYDGKVLYTFKTAPPVTQATKDVVGESVYGQGRGGQGQDEVVDGGIDDQRTSDATKWIDWLMKFVEPFLPEREAEEPKSTHPGTEKKPSSEFLVPALNTSGQHFNTKGDVMQEGDSPLMVGTSKPGVQFVVLAAGGNSHTTIEVDPDHPDEQSLPYIGFKP